MAQGHAEPAPGRWDGRLVSDDISADELLGATPWMDPRERGVGIPPPLRVRQKRRPPRELHIERVGEALCAMILHEWYAILGPAPAWQGERAKREAVGWYSRSSYIVWPAWMAAAASRALRGLDEQDLIVVLPPEPPKREVQQQIPVKGAEGGSEE